MKRLGLILLGLCTTLAWPALSSAKITLRLVYDFDSDTDPYGMFDAETPGGVAARAVLDRAVATCSDRLMDTFTAITSGESGTFNGGFLNPGTGAMTSGVNSVPPNVVNIYVGARAMDSGTLAVGAYGAMTITGATQAFIDNARSRGQPGTLASPRTDYALWGGSISFNTSQDWFTGLTTQGLPGTTQYDMFTVATHELVHVLGFTAGPSGDRTSFFAKINGGAFTGPRAVAAYGGVVPVTGTDLSHWNDITAHVDGGTQKAVMNATLGVAERRRMTDVDWAALADLGWQLARPGDANADGMVNFADLVVVAQNYNTAGPTRWATGDFNDDGLVNFSDLAAVAQNYNTSGSLGSSVHDIAGTDASSFSSDLATAQAMATAPEPGLAMMLAGLLLLLQRRRHIVASASSR